jgi:hypothetical protein
MSMYRAGDWLVICDICGQKSKASQVKKRWDGMIVCPDDYEERHIQDFLRVSPDTITVPFIRNPEDTFLPAVCSIITRSPYANLGTADCMTVSSLFTYEEILASYVCDVEGNRPDAEYGTADCATVR